MHTTCAKNACALFVRFSAMTVQRRTTTRTAGRRTDATAATRSRAEDGSDFDEAKAELAA
jgi:hypothetical protein